MICPQCKTTLDMRDRAGARIGVCCTCDGVWLDRDAIERFLVMVRARLNELNLGLRSTVSRSSQTSAQGLPADIIW